MGLLRSQNRGFSHCTSKFNGTITIIRFIHLYYSKQMDSNHDTSHTITSHRSRYHTKRINLSTVYIMRGWIQLYLIWMMMMMKPIMMDTECPDVSVHEDRRVNNTRLRIVQYNVEWMFLEYYAAADCPGNGCSWKNESEAQKHLDGVVKVIQELNPDIINLCEIEGCDELNAIRNRMADATYFPYLKKGKDTATGQNVGMLTRIDPIQTLYRTEEKYLYPVVNSECGYAGNSSVMGVSKHYITEFSFDRLRMAFIAAHLLALPSDKMRCAEREAQAMVLQKVIYDYIQRGYDIIVLGDFNDYDVEIPDVNNNQPISRVLDILKGNTGDFAETYQLYSVAERILSSQRYSDWWDSDNNCKTSSMKDYSLIDHILVSKNVQDRLVNAFIYHGYQEYCGKYDSDHFPVVIDLHI